MSNYIEVNSTYRDRNLWPLSGQFEIPIAQTGTRDKQNAFDPVCVSTPLTSWTSNKLNTNVGSQTQIIGTILSTGVGLSSNDISFTITTTNPLQQIENYYVGLIFTDTTLVLKSTIVSYTYLGGDGAGNYKAFITVSNNLTGLNLGDNFTIDDGSDFSVPTVPLLFVPDGRTQANAYSNYIVYNETRCEYRNVTFYDNIFNIISFDSIVGAGWTTTNNYSIRKTPPLLTFNIIVSSTGTTFVLTGPQNCIPNTITNYYRKYFLRIYPKSYVNSTPTSYYSEIISSSYSGGNYTFTVSNTITTSGTVTTDYLAEVLEFSYDNFNPFTYIGTLVQQASCFEFELVNLILPNFTLSSGFGSKIAFYPFVYVELTNVSSSTAYSKNMLQSNDPNAIKNLFRVPIYDVQDPESTPFVRLLDCNMVQTIKFKPDDNLFFSVILPNGDIFNTLLPEYYSPAIPNPNSQVSAIFRYKRII